MIKCMLVDDEPLAMEVIASYLDKITGFEIVAKCKNALEAFEVLQKQEVALIFLDINMPQLSGIEFVKTLKNPPKIIFTTAHRDYAIEGYELNAVDYLLKPISFGRFMKAINKIQRKPIETNSVETVINVNTDPFLYVKMDKKVLKVYLDDIIYIRYQDRISTIFLKDNSMIEYRIQLRQLMSELNYKSHFLFSQINQNYIVHFKIVTIDHFEGEEEEYYFKGYI